MSDINEDLKIIKKKYGENMMHLCRSLFATLLEKEGLLSKLMLEYFYPNRDLYDDIINNNIIDEFKNYIYSFVDVEEKEEIEIIKTPKELLSLAGYNLYECRTYEDVERFKKYYSAGEELCTFRDIKDRLNRCHVFFAVKKDVDNINRKDFTNPERQDLYGTSVISLQFTKDKSHTLSIKNRYNHTVNNPDSTFSNNLDNIIDGLTQAFENEYGLIQGHGNNRFEIPNYVRANDGKFYKYNYEINNKYYCDDNIIIDNFKVVMLPKERYILFDYFILDMQEKKIELYDTDILDSFIESIGKISKIDIEKEENIKKIVITPEEGENIIITLDKSNRILGLVNNNVHTIGNDFLFYNNQLTTLELPNLQIVGDAFLSYNKQLTTLGLPNLQKVGDRFLYNNESLTTLELPNLREVGDYFLYHNKQLIILELPSLQKVGGDFLYYNKQLTILELPNLREVGNYFLGYNNQLTTLELPNLREVGNYFLGYNNQLTILELPNLQKVGKNFLYYNDRLTILELPNLQKAGSNFLCNNDQLTILELPNLQEVGDSFLEHNYQLTTLELPNLQEVGDYFLFCNGVLRNQILKQLRSNKRR